MKLTQSQVILSIASVVTLALTWQTFQENQSTETVLPTRVVSQAQVIQSPSIDPEIDLVLANRPLVPSTGDLFAKPKRAKAKVVKRTYRKAVPQEVAVPPLPFSYIGRWQDKDKRVIMLDHRGEILMVQEGDVIANQYKVESIDETAGHIQINFLMMSLNKTQSLQARVGQP